MFRGNHQTRVDEKFRLKLPAEFKRRVDEIYGPLFYITSVDGKRAQLYPMKEWEAIEAKIVQLEPTDPEREDFLNVTSYYGQTVEMDSQGRLLLPPGDPADGQAGRRCERAGHADDSGSCECGDVRSGAERAERSCRDVARDSRATLAEKTKALKG